MQTMKNNKDIESIILQSKTLGFTPHTMSTIGAFKHYIDYECKYSGFVNDTCIRLLIEEIRLWLIDDFNIHVIVSPHAYEEPTLLYTVEVRSYYVNMHEFMQAFVKFRNTSYVGALIEGVAFSMTTIAADKITNTESSETK